MPIHEQVRTILVKKTSLSRSSPAARSVDSKHPPYSCSYCAKLFSSPSHLSRHILIHTGEKPCLCPECGQQFSQISSLERHQRTKHIRNKTIHSSTNHSYQCSLCQEYFSLKHNLKMHERKLHQIPTSFFCNPCSAYFTCNSSLQKHRNFRHRSVTKPPPPTISDAPSTASPSHMSDNWMLVSSDQLNSSTGLLPCQSVGDRSPGGAHATDIDLTRSISPESTGQPSYPQQHVEYQILPCNEMN